MKVIRGIGALKKSFKKTVLAIGVFDGVHLGHQLLILKAIQKARALKGTAMVMTFFPHPVHVLRPEIYLPLVVSLKHRLKLIESLGADACLVVHFTKRFSSMNPESFIKKYFAETIKPSEIFIGDDFRFGKNRSGDVNLLKESGQQYGFKVNILTSVKKGKEIIGSTLVRKYIREGNLKKASRLLGRNVSVLGKVVKGASRGKKLGFPTANISLHSDTIPPCGVYLVAVTFNKKTYRGMANIGTRPSFEKNNVAITVEVHIFNFRKNIYGAEIVLEFVKKIRNEKKFSSKEGLIAQLKKDEKQAKRLFEKPTL